MAILKWRRIFTHKAAVLMAHHTMQGKTMSYQVSTAFNSLMNNFVNLDANDTRE